MDPPAVRDSLIARLERDLVGPDAPDEIIEGERARPSDVYLTGILWPVGDRMGAADDDGSDGDDEADQGPSAPGVTGQQRPCSMGISFATASTMVEHRIHIRVDFATYVAEQTSDGKTGKQRVRWCRRQHTFSFD